MVFKWYDGKFKLLKVIQNLNVEYHGNLKR